MSDGKWAMPCQKCGKRIEWIGEFSKRPKCKCELPAATVKQANQPADGERHGPFPIPAKRRSVTVPTTPQADDTAKEAIELCDEIESLAEDVPSRGEDFAMSVLERAADIRATVEALGRATGPQISALENMRDGLSRWIR